MFHQGDLQSGISLALQQAKSVVCFVRDASEESGTWEDEWLSSEPLATLLAQKTVALRLEAGSQEAGFLSAFCPIPKTPALVVIHNGQLKLCLLGEVSRDDFTSRLRAVLDPDVVEPSSNMTATEATMDNTPDDVTPVQPESDSITNEPPAAQATTPPAISPTETSPSTSNPADSTQNAATSEPRSSADLNSLFPDRAARLEADHQVRQEAEAAARAAKAAGKRKAVDEEVASAGSKDSKQLSYAAQEKIRKQAQQDELNRILQRVEADKRERKEREELRKRQREAELHEFAGAEFAVPMSPVSETAKRASISGASRGPTAKSGDVCLRIRLLDGSQVREYFSPTATLQADVRPRVDWALSSGPGPSSSSSKAPSAPPYSFKHILAPLPNRTLSPSDETKPLNELPDIMPSATLVLVPVKNAVGAYSGLGGGYVGSIYVAMVQLYNMFAALLATFFAPFARGRGGQEGGSGDGGATVGGAQDGQGQGKSSGRVGGSTGANGSGSGSGSGIRIRTLRDQGERGNEYYNGNSLDFEPKKENKEDEKDK
ncbi:UBX domain-containing protein [Lasiodiplodia theobromae]|uniref:UBX domain-containing protein n=1 Tax=Lasiodiplodia theobromae TaxID=45133 RepID=UPI0015C3571A|nr:UBX domain-containing protein [Lasiodiplodia theobromae]KAF4541387.1 UBX domain-containing protein [Lasiodiplodia theobromae]